MILALVGPTGIGKTEATIALASRLPSEIVVVDSMQVYRGMDIGTGKPSPDIRQEVPHHGIDLVEPEEEFDAARYARTMRPAVEGILRRERCPILVGGCGLYFRALVDGLCPAPAKDPFVRDGLLQELKDRGSAKLHTRLGLVDPESAGRIHPNDWKKIVRALEVFTVTRRPISDWQREDSPSFKNRRFGREEIFWIGLTLPRALLYRRIEDRIDRWISQGWLEEARRLSCRNLSMTAGEALGYRELFSYLEGDLSWEETTALIKRNTRRYAKRQETWFRADKRIRWISPKPESPQETADRILEEIPRDVPIAQWNGLF